jgi:hypothetical protein
MVTNRLASDGERENKKGVGEAKDNSNGPKERVGKEGYVHNAEEKKTKEGEVDFKAARTRCTREQCTETRQDVWIDQCSPFFSCVFGEKQRKREGQTWRV